MADEGFYRAEFAFDEGDTLGAKRARRYVQKRLNREGLAEAENDIFVTTPCCRGDLEVYRTLQRLEDAPEAFLRVRLFWVDQQGSQWVYAMGQFDDEEEWE